MRYAFFDLDHTLLPFDTQALFCNFVLRRHPWRIVLHLWFIPFALGKAVGLVSTAVNLESTFGARSDCLNNSSSG